LRYVASIISAFSFVGLFAGLALGQTNPPPAPAQANPSPGVSQVSPPLVDLFVEGASPFVTSGAWYETIPVAICTPSSTVVCPAISGPYATANMTSSFTKSWGIGLGARLRFTRHDALDLSYSVSFNHLSLHASATNPTTGKPLVESGTSFDRLYLASINYARYFLVSRRVQPYATAGLGTSHFSGSLGATAVDEGLIGGSDRYQFAWNFGGGTDVILRHHLVLRFDVRDYHVGQPLPIRGTVQDITPSAGVVYRFP
jgi:opacity protein-like surface antigen